VSKNESSMSESAREMCGLDENLKKKIEQIDELNNTILTLKT